MIYLKIDLANAKALQARNFLKSEFAKDLPDNILSVNAKQDGTVAWVKLVRGADLSAFNGILLDFAATKDDHRKKVVADVTTRGWYPDEEEV